MRKHVKYVLNYIQGCDSFPCCLLELAIIATKTWPLPKIIIIHHCLPKGRLARDCGLVLSLVATLPAWCHVIRACEKRGDLIAGCHIKSHRLDHPRGKVRGGNAERDGISFAVALMLRNSVSPRPIPGKCNANPDWCWCTPMFQHFFFSLCLSSSHSLPPITPL